MLKAILHGKIRGSVIDIYDGGSWRKVLHDIEDFLTAGVFGTLLYLPVGTFLELIRKALLSNSFNADLDSKQQALDLPKITGELSQTEFWPSWWVTDGFGKQQRVEPDVFLQFENFDFIVEAKRYDHYEQQDPVQLGREIAAYLQRRPATGKVAYLLAIGGIGHSGQRTIAETTRLAFQKSQTFGQQSGPVKLIFLEWKALLRETIRLLSDNPPQYEARIIQDVIEVFNFFGFRIHDPVWLADMPNLMQEFALKLDEPYASFVASWPDWSRPSRASDGLFESIPEAFRTIKSESIDTLWRINVSD